MLHVALVSSRQHIQEDPDLPLLADALNERGITTSCVVWDDAAVEWSSYTLVVVRSCWDYPARHQEFLHWARQVPRLANPYNVLEWNTDKRYLQALSSHGVNIIPTAWTLEATSELEDAEAWVVKPTVSASGRDTFMALSKPEALKVASRLEDTGRRAMIQPYVSEIEAQGELALVYIDGNRSHCTLKQPLLESPSQAEKPRAVHREPYEAIEAAHDTWTAADDVLRTTESLVSPHGPLLYARIDLVLRPKAAPVIMEVELAEP